MYNNTNREKMDFHSVMETFAEAWVAANTHTPLTEAAEQGLINGPSNHPTSNQIISNSSSNSQSSLTLNQSVSNQGSSQPILTVLQEPPKIVIENTASIDNSHRNGRLSPNDSSSGDVIKPYKVQEVHGKCLPVHCIVEQIPGPQACGQYVELDSYAIVPSETLFSDLVRTALGKLGYSVSQVLGAKGSIKVKKWKPLAFDQITDNPEATVGDILGELTTVASLHVRLYSVPDNPQEWKDTTVRNAVLELLREMSQSKLAKTCPLSQPMLSNIINNRYLGKIGKEKCQEFGQWYLSYRKQHPAEKSTPEVVPSDRPVDGRLTFHPSKELPIMRDWFHSCRNPSRRTLQTYVDILNQGPVRQQESFAIMTSLLRMLIGSNDDSDSKYFSDSNADSPLEESNSDNYLVMAQTPSHSDVRKVSNVIATATTPHVMQSAPLNSIADQTPEVHVSDAFASTSIATTSGSFAEILSHVQKGKRKRNESGWKKNMMKVARNSGKEYQINSKKHEKQVRQERKMKPPCQEKCRLRCFEKITEAERKTIFDSYWNLGDIVKQRQFIHSCAAEVRPKYRYGREGGVKRNNNSAFYFTIGDRHIRVCKLFFKNTLDINDRPIRTVLEKKDKVSGAVIAEEKRGKHKHHKRRTIIDH